jgi:transcriptional antiterminator
VEKTEDLLEKFKIKLERTPGQGMSINGAEKEIRMIMEYLANSYLTEYDIYSFTNQLLQLSDSVSPILLFDERSGLKDIYQTVITKVAKLNQQGQLKDYNYVDLLALVIKLTISVSRLKIGHSIGGFNLMPRDAQDNILMLMEEIFSEYNFPIFKDEYHYLSNDLDHETVEDLLKFTDQIIQLVSQKMNLPFDLDEQLRINLNAHLTLSFSKKRIYVNEYNPYVKDVRELNPKLFNTVSRVCKQVFKSLNIPITNSFVSYIVLHFLASIENQKQTTERIRAVYVCSTGLGVTTLIQRKID